jgi:hypothetical protein
MLLLLLLLLPPCQSELDAAATSNPDAAAAAAESQRLAEEASLDHLQQPCTLQLAAAAAVWCLSQLGLLQQLLLLLLHPQLHPLQQY